MTEIRRDNYLRHIGCKEEKISAYINKWQTPSGRYSPYAIPHPAQGEQQASGLHPWYAILFNRGSMRQND